MSMSAFKRFLIFPLWVEAHNISNEANDNPILNDSNDDITDVIDSNDELKHDPMMVKIGGSEIDGYNEGQPIIPAMMDNREGFNEAIDLAYNSPHGGIPYRRCATGRFTYGKTDPGCADGMVTDRDGQPNDIDMNFMPIWPSQVDDWQIPQKRPHINIYGTEEDYNSTRRYYYGWTNYMGGPMSGYVDTFGQGNNYSIPKQKNLKYLQGYYNQFEADSMWDSLWDNIDRIGYNTYWNEVTNINYTGVNSWFNNVDYSDSEQRQSAPGIKPQKFVLKGNRDDGSLTSFKLWPYGAGAYGQNGMQMNANLPGGTRNDVKPHDIGSVNDPYNTFGLPKTVESTPGNRMEPFETYLNTMRLIPSNYKTMHDALIDLDRGEPHYFQNMLLKSGRGPQFWTYNELKEIREARNRSHYKPADLYAPTVRPHSGPLGYNPETGEFDPWHLQDIELQEPKIDEIDHSIVQLDKYDPSQLRGRNRPTIKNSELYKLLIHKYMIHWNHLGTHLGPTFLDIGNCRKDKARCSMEGYEPTYSDRYMITEDRRGKNRKLWIEDNPLVTLNNGTKMHSSLGLRRIDLRTYSNGNGSNNRFLGLGYDSYLERLVGLQTGLNYEDPWGWIGETDLKQRNEKIIVFTGGNYDMKEYEVNWDLMTMDRFIPMSQATLLEDRWACYMDWQMALPEIKKQYYTPKICSTTWDHKNENMKAIPDGNLATPRGFTKFLNLTDVTDVVRNRRFNEPNPYVYEAVDQTLSDVPIQEWGMGGQFSITRYPLRWRGYMTYVDDSWRKRYPFEEKGDVNGAYYPGVNKHGTTSSLRKFRLSEITLDWRRVGPEVDENYQWAPNWTDAWGMSGNFAYLPESQSYDPTVTTGRKSYWNLFTTADLFGTVWHNASSENPGIRGRNIRFWSRENPFRGPGHYEIDQPRSAPLSGESSETISGASPEEIKEEIHHDGYHVEDREVDRDYTTENWLEMDMSIRIPLKIHRGYSRSPSDTVYKIHKKKNRLPDVQAVLNRHPNEDGLHPDWIDWTLRGTPDGSAGPDSRWNVVPSPSTPEHLADYRYTWKTLDVMDLCPGPQDRLFFHGMTHIKDYYFVSFTIMGVNLDDETGDILPPGVHDDTHQSEIMHIPRPCNPMAGEVPGQGMDHPGGSIPERVQEFLQYFMGNPLEIDMNYNYPTFLLRFKTTELWNASSYDSIDFDYTWSPEGVVPMSWLGKNDQEYYQNPNSYAGRDWPFHWMNVDLPDMARRPTNCMLSPWEPDLELYGRNDITDPDLTRYMHMVKEDFLICHDRITGNLWRFNWFNAWYGNIELSEFSGESETEKKDIHESIGSTYNHHELPEREEYFPFWRYFEGSDKINYYDPMVKWSFIWPGSHSTSNMLCNFCHEVSWAAYDLDSSTFMAGIRDHVADRMSDGYFFYCLQCPFGILIGNSSPPGDNAVSGGRSDYVPGAPIRRETNRHPYRNPKKTRSGVDGNKIDDMSKRKLGEDSDDETSKPPPNEKEKKKLKFKAFLESRRFEHALNSTFTKMRRLTTSADDDIDGKSDLQNKLVEFRNLFDNAVDELTTAEKEARKNKKNDIHTIKKETNSMNKASPYHYGDSITRASSGSYLRIFDHPSTTTTTTTEVFNDWRDRPFLDISCEDYYFEFGKPGGWSANFDQYVTGTTANTTPEFTNTLDSIRWRTARHCKPLSEDFDLWTRMGAVENIPSSMKLNKCFNWKEVTCSNNAYLNSECYTKRADESCWLGETPDSNNCSHSTECYWEWIDDLIGYTPITIDDMSVTPITVADSTESEESSNISLFDKPKRLLSSLRFPSMKDIMSWPSYLLRPNGQDTGHTGSHLEVTSLDISSNSLRPHCKLPMGFDKNIIKLEMSVSSVAAIDSTEKEIIGYLHGWVVLMDYDQNNRKDLSSRNQLMMSNMNRRGIEKIVRNIPLHRGFNSFTPCIVVNENPSIVRKGEPPLWMMSWYSLWPNGGDEFYRMKGIFDDEDPDLIMSYGHDDISKNLVNQVVVNKENNSQNRLDFLWAPKNVWQDESNMYHSRCIPMMDHGCYLSYGDPDEFRHEEDIVIGPGLICSDSNAEPTNGFISDLGMAGKTTLWRISTDFIPDMEFNSTVWGGLAFRYDIPDDISSIEDC